MLSEKNRYGKDHKLVGRACLTDRGEYAIPYGAYDVDGVTMLVVARQDLEKDKTFCVSGYLPNELRVLEPDTPSARKAHHEVLTGLATAIDRLLGF